MSDLKNIKEKYSTKLNNKLSLDEINQIKIELFGKNGLISSQFKNIGSIPETEKKNLHLI
jgi:phenylalanyl-tRNA synthetase alpha chain